LQIHLNWNSVETKELMPEDHLQDDDAFHPKINLALWRGLLRFARPYRWHLLGLSLIAMACALGDVTLPWLTGRFVDEITHNGAGAQLLRYEIANVVVITVLSVCIFAFIILAGHITTGISYDLREAAFDRTW